MFIGYFKMKINLKNIILHSKKLNMISNRFYDKKTGQADNVGLYCFLKKKGGLYVGPIMHFFILNFMK
jgi:hypothetical protein